MTGSALAIGGVALSGTAAATDSVVEDVSFRGCSEVWIALRYKRTIRPVIHVFDDETKCIEKREMCVEKYDFTQIPGQYGSLPVFKYSVPEGYKILAVSCLGWYQNCNGCAENASKKVNNR